MGTKKEKPNLLVSSCLGIKKCRWNNVTIQFDFLENLRPYVNIFTTCPEVEIGLGVPRKTIRIIGKKEKEMLVQPATGRDVTEDMGRFSESYLDSLPEMDGFILKYGSPSCGPSGIKIYPEEGNWPVKGVRPGFFAKAVLEKFSHAALIDEGRITNFELREAFLTKLFALHGCRNVSSIKELTEFHAQYKFILLAYSEKAMREMGRIAANTKEEDFSTVKENYMRILSEAFKDLPTKGSYINAFVHSYGFVKDKLTEEEKVYFDSIIKEYRAGIIPLAVPKHLLHAWAIRHNEKYLKEQMIFTPYPSSLVTVRDSGKGCRL
jgi:uncharacterized protein YbgA (DUF1722 family)/uncharacterized protein YbbK (DUF523 family)